ncbi:hypothetical protein B0H12DRAFT_125889 [Mycena haematopus]|nr:hypothetical protein B0H12DRAFT_125889 [Mycena haematopus]
MIPSTITKTITKTVPGPRLSPTERAKLAFDTVHDAHFEAFPVVVTTYAPIIRVRYITDDEGHRLRTCTGGDQALQQGGTHTAHRDAAA